MEYKYDRESVQELLAWAKSILESNSLPAGPLQMSQSAKVLDCKFYLEALSGVVKAHWENATFRSSINQLYDFRAKLEEMEA